jgi:hypothetical protein
VVVASDDIDGAPIRGFISYRRIDNSDFDDVVDVIARTLSAMFEARTGQPLNLFLDRASIGWGEDWRDKIDASVRQATVFIPIVTMRYFNSNMCMEELLTFEASARELGVTDLILPLVLFGDEISETDPRPEVRLIARLNYKSIESAWQEGYSSPMWRKLMVTCAKELAEALARVETALLEADTSAAAEQAHKPTEPPAITEGGSPVQLVTVLDDDLDLPGLTAEFQEVTAVLELASAAVEELGDIADSAFDGVNVETADPRKSAALMLKAAHDMREPSRRLEDLGEQSERKMLDVDPKLRKIVRELQGIDLPAAQEYVSDLIGGVNAAELAESEASIIELHQQIQLVSVLNVSIRKSLQPALRGLRSMLTAISIFKAWGELRS